MTNAAHRTQLTRFDREGRALRTSDTSALFILVSVVATLGVVAYSMFLLNPANRGDFLPYALVIIAESVLVVQALLSMWTILSSGYEPRDFPYHEAKRLLMPRAPLDMLAKNSLRRMFFVVQRGWFLGVPIPSFLLPRSRAKEFALADRFHFDVGLYAPLTGELIVHYQGHVRPDAVGHAPGGNA